MSNIERLIVTIGSTIAMLIFAGASAYCLAIGETAAAQTCGVLAGLSGFATLVTRIAGGNGNGAAKLVTVGILVASTAVLAACGSAQPACTVYDGVHRTACSLCAATEQPCPFAPHDIDSE